MSRIKSVMRSFIYWPRMDCDIELLVKKNCRGCALAENSPPIKFESWPKTGVLWKRLYIDFAGPLNGSHYSIMVDSFSKWPKILTVSANFLNEILARFGVLVTLGTQFTTREFLKFCKFYYIEHTTTPVYHPWSNRQVERFMDSF